MLVADAVGKTDEKGVFENELTPNCELEIKLAESVLVLLKLEMFGVLVSDNGDICLAEMAGKEADLELDLLVSVVVDFKAAPMLVVKLKVMLDLEVSMRTDLDMFGPSEKR